VTFQTMCALRIYLRRGDNAIGEKSFWRRLFKRPLHAYLLQQALRAGVTHAALSLGHMGFTKGAPSVSADVSDVPTSSMPVCVELVGPKPLLEQFVRDHARQIADATLVMLEGVHVRPQIVEDEPAASAPHHVEYLNVDGVSLPIDHIDVTEPPTKPHAEAEE
jgi:PII-like signaling protein